ncbi:SpoIIE family protein phosphatase [Caldibacillus lycopersici]|uniref:SpoIIE family protein phosphatase n=1 Tax=Perspicuibacillus lycopersici TaxID=1325689 RepID=A0AAE3IXH9_9BACI|nr:PP2C family serine/threonine-protein phosphatase [Perspicuibacillus lycopersici]MCU9615171.1 SpoIIE family protein phosphatase [Perspicuibacillus lycopersici]
MNCFQSSKIHVFASQAMKNGNQVNGDGYYYYFCDNYFICVVADGLGSGVYANESSEAVISVVKEHHEESVDTIMNYCNKVLSNKRGAAVLLLKVYFDKRELEYSCIGNIRFLISSPSGKLIYPIPVTGYLSGKPQFFHSQTYSYQPSTKFLIYSDGLAIRSGKSYIMNELPIERIAVELQDYMMNNQQKDDATFIIGSINQ